MNDRHPTTGSPFAAPASSVGAYYPWLDALRGLSWILVVIGHTILPFGFLARMGVGIFFAISGWLITRIILGQLDREWSLVTFYTRRAIRIIPLYYVLVVLAVASSLLFPHWKAWFEWFPPDTAEHTLWKYLLTFATEEWRGSRGGLLVGHAWSLGVEERFYVFWPLLLTLWPGVKGARRILIVSLILLFWAALALLPNEAVTTALWALPFPLLFGCALAIFEPFRLQSISRRITLPAAAAAFTAYVVFADLVERFQGPTICVFSFLPGILAAILTAAAIASDGAPRNVVLRALQGAGKISYAAYLFHPIFAFLAIKAARAIGVPWLAPVFGVAMIGPLALLVHRYVETPFLALRPRIERSRRLRTFLSVLQTGPIVAGLVFLFPWRALAGQLSAHPALLLVAALALTGLAGAAALRLGHPWGRIALEGLSSLEALARGALVSRGVPFLAFIHRVLRRSATMLTVGASVVLGLVALVAITGGFRWTLGSVIVSLRKLDRPTEVLFALLVLRFVAAIDVPRLGGNPAGAVEETGAASD